jgi:glycosyltransferase involved in cell wall biosynthesis
MTEYAVVTPVRNEAENLLRLAQCLAGQSLRPRSWMIVDTGSDDETLQLAADLAAEHDWISSLASLAANGPTRAAAIVRAFHVGVRALADVPDIVVKLDADVSMGSDYFRLLVAAFDGDPQLGLASGTCYERNGAGWHQRHVTGEHVWGASRAYRRECLESVSPLEERLGWDGVDEIKAALRGWRTRTLLDLPFYHHRREGEREGRRARAWTTVGDASHYLGYRPDYLVLRALNYARRDPTALAMISGYLGAALRGVPRCPDTEVRSFVRRQQSLRQLPLRMREALGKRAG